MDMLKTGWNFFQNEVLGMACIFQSFCKRVLHNEACNAHEEIRRRRAKEVSFSDLALDKTRACIKHTSSASI